MNAHAAATHRDRVLHALGLVPWQRRASHPAEVTVAEPLAEVGGHADCVVLLPTTCDARELDLLGRALISAGPALARAARIRVDAAGLLDAPAARAYLACGEAQAHALGRSLSAPVTAQAQIVLVDAPAQLLREGAAKRRLWIALRNLRRLLAAGSP